MLFKKVLLALSGSAFALGLNAGSVSWDFAQGLQGWSVKNAQKVTADAHGLACRINGKSVLVSPELNLNAADSDTMELVLSSTRNDVFGFCFASSASPVIVEYKILKALPATGKLCVFRQHLNRAINWTGTVQRLELYPGLGEADFRLQSVRFFKASENMLFWGDMSTVLEGEPAEWTLANGAKFHTAPEGNYIALTGRASAKCPFASLDKLSGFQFKVETRGASGRVKLRFFGEHDELLSEEKIASEASGDWKEVAVKFRPHELAWRGEITFEADNAGEFQIRHVSAVRAADLPLPQTPAIEVKTFKNSGTGFPKCEVRRENGVGTIYIDGIRKNSIHNWFWKHPAEHLLNAKDVAHLELAAIDLGPTGAGFTEKGFDYTAVDELLALHASAHPEAYFFLYFDFSGVYFQKWWCDAHPEALCRPEDGSDKMYAYGGGLAKCCSMSSEVWLSTFEDVLRRLVRHIKASPYASRVIGFQTEAGMSYEWLQYGSQNQQFADYSECAREAFRKFLKARYPSDKALQKAWNNPAVTLESVKIPPTTRRAKPANGTFFDPKTEQDVLDHNEFSQQVVSHAITRFAKAVKEESEGCCLTGAFYGYTNYLHDMIFGGVNAGNADARHVLDSPYVDYLIAPVAYNQRRPGAFIQTMSTPWSCNVNGKMFINQVDFRTHHAPEHEYYRTDNLAESAGVLYRELARNLAEGNTFQFLDFGAGWIFGDKRLAAVAGKMAELFGQYRWTVRDFAPENYLLVVVDERCMEKFNCFQPPFERELIYNQMTYLDAAGIPWRCVLLSDLMKHPELQEYGAFLFLNQFRMDDEIAEFLQKKILTKNRLAAFVGPVGILTPEGIDTHYPEKLLGKKFHLDTVERNAHCTATALWPELKGEMWGSSRRETQAYIMLPDGAQEEEIVGRMQGDNVPGALWLEKRDCKVYWSAVASTTPAMLRALARKGNLPVVSDENDAHFIGCGFLGIHAHSAGLKTIRLIGEGTPKDILTGETWPEGTKEIQLPMKFGENRIFIME